MKWSWKVVRFAGIDVFIHITFLLLPLYFGLVAWRQNGSLAAVIEAIVFILAVFGCVVCHEFGHALTARQFGIKTRDITLLPIGGVASLESMPEKPQHEILVALAGPAVNVVIAALIGFWLNSQGELQDMTSLANQEHTPFIFQLMFVNIFLAVFNLLPAFPMDGGRVLRALLAFGFSRVRATLYAARIGQVFAVVFALYGLLGNGPTLVLIGIFLWFAAATEANMEQMKSMMQEFSTAQAMLTEFHLLSVDDTLARAVELTLTSHQRDFPVVDGSKLVGVLTHRDLLRELVEKNTQSLIREASLHPVGEAAINEPLSLLLDRMQANNMLMLAVKNNNNEIVGLLTLENVLELLNFYNAVKIHKPPTGKRWI
jgi:Zn-dependent protease/CBS domain-containing protein